MSEEQQQQQPDQPLIEEVAQLTTPDKHDSSEAKESPKSTTPSQSSAKKQRTTIPLALKRNDCFNKGSPQSATPRRTPTKSRAGRTPLALQKNKPRHKESPLISDDELSATQLIEEQGAAHSQPLTQKSEPLSELKIKAIETANDEDIKLTNFSVLCASKLLDEAEKAHEVENVPADIDLSNVPVTALAKEFLKKYVTSYPFSMEKFKSLEGEELKTACAKQVFFETNVSAIADLDETDYLIEISNLGTIKYSGMTIMEEPGIKASSFLTIEGNLNVPEFYEKGNIIDHLPTDMRCSICFRVVLPGIMDLTKLMSLLKRFDARVHVKFIVAETDDTENENIVQSMFDNIINFTHGVNESFKHRDLTFDCTDVAPYMEMKHFKEISNILEAILIHTVQKQGCFDNYAISFGKAVDVNFFLGSTRGIDDVIVDTLNKCSNTHHHYGCVFELTPRKKQQLDQFKAENNAPAKSGTTLKRTLSEFYNETSSGSGEDLDKENQAP